MLRISLAGSRHDGERATVSEAEAIQEKALRVLQVAVVEARDEPGTYVSRARVMQQTNISDVGEFRAIAEYLARRGFITEGVNDYEFFVLTLEGIAEGTE
jgi:hypothetical protein